ncbi:MAG: ATP-grasp fold amidoligase family protein [Vitreimonas sp.]
MGQGLGGIDKQIGRVLYRCALELMPAELSLAVQFRRTQARWPDLQTPQSFNEKLQWRKLHDRNPILPALIDKIAVKALLAERADAREWLIPTLWRGTRLSAEILASIPAPYVIKPNHASGRILFNRGDCADLAAFAARANAMLAAPHPRFLREGPYARIRPQLLIEPFIGAGLAMPYDYKLYAFHGRVRFIQVDTDRERDHKRALYSPDWERLPFQFRINQRTQPVSCPSRLPQMIAFAERLAVDLALDFIRVDLYDVDGRAWFGELTPFPSSGFAKFDPPSADFEIGRFWSLPTKTQPASAPLGAAAHDAPGGGAP